MLTTEQNQIAVTKLAAFLDWRETYLQKCREVSLLGALCRRKMQEAGLDLAGKASTDAEIDRFCEESERIETSLGYWDAINARNQIEREMIAAGIEFFAEIASPAEKQSLFYLATKKDMLPTAKTKLVNLLLAYTPDGQ